MILTGDEIKKEISCGNIFISPFNEERLNPNSYNYCLGSKLIIMDLEQFDSKQKIKKKIIEIPENGYMLEPRILYLGSTLEKIGSSCYAISLIGRSSLGRLGMHLQLAANLGHTGTNHCWTLEIRVCLPLNTVKISIIHYRT